MFAHPKISEPIRDLILKTAKRLGYVPDSRMATLISGVRSTKTRERLPIA